MDKLILIDTPGTNDIKTELSDEKIQKIKHLALAPFFSDPNQGVSGIVQCIMIDAGGRLKNTSVESMSRTLHSLTFSNPKFSPLFHKGPRLNVVFTNYSRFNHGDESIMIPGAKQKEIKQSALEFEHLIAKFKKELVQQLIFDLHEAVTEEEIAKKVD
mmetsp:Transcript_15319/g.23583  ORF Transcript_15319/g.23583 Transcript_15319/m.23583 type:complete len:158 (-) Transcript_15319:806-1279(-)